MENRNEEKEDLWKAALRVQGHLANYPQRPIRVDQPVLEALTVTNLIHRLIPNTDVTNVVEDLIKSYLHHCQEERKTLPPPDLP